MSNLKKFFIRFLGILSLLAVAFCIFAVYANYSTGKRAGLIIKMSKKGVIFKTYEGQLNTGGFSEAGGDITSSIWMFSVKPENDEVREQIDDAINRGERVKLYYEEKYIKIFFLGDTRYFVYKVEPL